MQVGPRLQTTSEIRDEFQRRVTERAQSNVDKLVTSRGEISVTFDATGLCDPAFKRQINMRKRGVAGFRVPGESRGVFDYSLPEFQQAMVKHSWVVCLCLYCVFGHFEFRRSRCSCWNTYIGPPSMPKLKSPYPNSSSQYQQLPPLSLLTQSY